MLNEKLVNRDGDQNPKLYLLRAQMCKIMGRVAELLVDTQQGISCDPSNLETFTKLSNLQAEVYLKESNIKKAEETLVKLFNFYVLIQEETGEVIYDSDSLFLAGKLYMIKGKLNEARKLINGLTAVVASSSIYDVLCIARSLMQHFLDHLKEESDQINSQIGEQKPSFSQLGKGKVNKKGKGKGKQITAVDSSGREENEINASEDAKRSITKDHTSDADKVRNVGENSHKLEANVFHHQSIMNQLHELRSKSGLDAEITKLKGMLQELHTSTKKEIGEKNKELQELTLEKARLQTQLTNVTKDAEAKAKEIATFKEKLPNLEFASYQRGRDEALAAYKCSPDFTADKLGAGREFVASPIFKEIILDEAMEFEDKGFHRCRGGGTYGLP